MFNLPYTIALHDTDAAGVLFSANLLRICHQAYEAMMSELGFALGDTLKHRRFGLPLAHIEGDFLLPMRCGDHVEIRARVAALNTHSFKMEYELLTSDGMVAARAATVHVCVNVNDYTSMPLPEELRAALTQHTAKK
jgi:1,4-dihydroxy-2-naphthoyl-CoA hydrolase